MTATRGCQAATFLLQVALDEARIRARIAAALRDYRQRQAPPWTQDTMAEYLREVGKQMAPFRTVSNRQYARWENEQSTPENRGIELIGKAIDLDPAVFYTPEEDDDDLADVKIIPRATDPRDEELRALHEELAAIREKLERQDGQMDRQRVQFDELLELLRQRTA